MSAVDTMYALVGLGLLAAVVATHYVVTGAGAAVRLALGVYAACVVGLWVVRRARGRAHAQ